MASARPAPAPGMAPTATCVDARGPRCAATSAIGRCSACRVTTCTTGTHVARATCAVLWTVWPADGRLPSSHRIRRSSVSKATLRTCRCRRPGRRSHCSALSAAALLPAILPTISRDTQRCQRKSSHGLISSAASSASWRAGRCPPFHRRTKACRRRRDTIAITFRSIT